MRKIQIIILCILVVLLTACSGKLETVDMVIEPGPEAEIPKISNEVTVHTVVGTVKGEIVAEDDADKWVRTELAVVTQHPFSLIENSLGKVFKAELVGYDEAAGIAYLHFKNSTKLKEAIEEIDPKSFEMPLTYKERLQLKATFAEAIAGHVASKQIEVYENPLFKQNPDEIEAFIYDFEAAIAAFKSGEDVESYKGYIANDALVNAFENLSEEAKAETYARLKVKSIDIGEFSTIAKAEFTLQDVPDSEFVKATYSIIKIDGTLRIVNVQYAE